MKSILGMASIALFICSFAGADVLDRVQGGPINTAKNKAAEPAGCANFSGDWKGTCTVEASGKKVEQQSKIAIEQMGCYGIKEDGDFVFIGALQTKSLALPPIPELTIANPIASTVTTGYYWNAGKTALTIKSTSVSQSLEAAALQNSSSSTGEMLLNGDKLEVNAKFEGGSLHCAYAKN